MSSLEVTLEELEALVGMTGGKGRRLERVALLSARGLDYEQRCVECVEVGIPSALVQSMRTFGGSAQACEYAATVLRNISPANPTCAEAVAGAGAAPILVAALKSHPGEAGLADQVACALGNIASGSDIRAEACSAAGAGPALVATLYAHMASPEVCEAVCVALGQLAALSEAE